MSIDTCNTYGEALDEDPQGKSQPFRTGPDLNLANHPPASEHQNPNSSAANTGENPAAPRLSQSLSDVDSRVLMEPYNPSFRPRDPRDRPFQPPRGDRRPLPVPVQVQRPPPAPPVPNRFDFRQGSRPEGNRPFFASPLATGANRTNIPGHNLV